MIKKILCIICCLYSLTSCGVNTLNWPTIELPFLSSDINSITLDFESRENGSFFDKIIVTDSEQSLSIYENIDGFPIKEEKETSIETNKYFIRLSVDFYLRETDMPFYRLVYYEYGIADGKIMLDDGAVHWLPGNFSLIYYDNVNFEHKVE